jgi:hypothetical protein
LRLQGLDHQDRIRSVGGKKHHVRLDRLQRPDFTGKIR